TNSIGATWSSVIASLAGVVNSSGYFNNQLVPFDEAFRYLVLLQFEGARGATSQLDHVFKPLGKVLTKSYDPRSDVTIAANNQFNPARCTVVITHGWHGGISNDTNDRFYRLASALAGCDYNVLRVGWPK